MLNGISAADAEYSRHTIVHISIITWMEVMVGVDEHSEMTAAFLRDNFVIQPITQDVASSTQPPKGVQTSVCGVFADAAN